MDTIFYYYNYDNAEAKHSLRTTRYGFKSVMAKKEFFIDIILSVLIFTVFVFSPINLGPTEGILRSSPVISPDISASEVIISSGIASQNKMLGIPNLKNNKRGTQDDSNKHYLIPRFSSFSLINGPDKQANSLMFGMFSSESLKYGDIITVSYILQDKNLSGFHLRC